MYKRRGIIIDLQLRASIRESSAAALKQAENDRRTNKYYRRAHGVMRYDEGNVEAEG